MQRVQNIFTLYCMFIGLIGGDMWCLFPIKLNTGQYVPCGRCAMCLHNKVDDLKVRLTSESEHSPMTVFVTLTQDENHNRECGVYKPDVQKFFKRLRKAGLKFKYFLISEYTPTSTRRPHYHFLMFLDSHYRFEYLEDLIDAKWQRGFISVSNVAPSRIKYVANYHATKGYSPKGKNKNFALYSKGLGESLLTERTAEFLRSKNGTMMYNGYRIRIPRYYRDQLMLSPQEKANFVYKHIEGPTSSDWLEKFKRAEWWHRNALKKLYNKKNILK